MKPDYNQNIGKINILNFYLYLINGSKKIDPPPLYKKN